MFVSIIVPLGILIDFPPFFKKNDEGTMHPYKFERVKFYGPSKSHVIALLRKK